MKWVHNDGGRAAAGFRGSARDCGVRAIAIAAELPYRDVYDAVFKLAREMGKGSPRDGLSTKVMHEFMQQLGWTWTATVKIGSGCTVHMDAAELPPGRLILRVSKHYAAVIDGVLHDTYDSSESVWDPSTKRCVYGYWRKDAIHVATQCDFVIGIVDAYGAIHYEKLSCNDRKSQFHAHYWPTQTHKRWRFKVRDWQLDDSMLSEVKLNEEDAEKVEALMRKILKVPEWVLRGDAWEAAGRPRGEAYEKFLRDFERKQRRKKK